MNENNRLAEVVVETRNAGDGGMTNVYDEKAISQMPTVSRSLYDIVRLMPQAVATKNGGISYCGVNNRYNAFMINGMANNDMYGLSSSGTNGGLSNANPVSLDALVADRGGGGLVRRAHERIRGRRHKRRHQIGHQRVPRQRLHLL